jgi:hypothetical protein
MYVYIYIHICIYIYTYIHIYLADAEDSSASNSLSIACVGGESGRWKISGNWTEYLLFAANFACINDIDDDDNNHVKWNSQHGNGFHNLFPLYILRKTEANIA